MCDATLPSPHLVTTAPVILLTSTTSTGLLEILAGLGQRLLQLDDLLDLLLPLQPPAVRPGHGPVAGAGGAEDVGARQSAHLGGGFLHHPEPRLTED